MSSDNPGVATRQRKNPPAPGGTRSPQRPGVVPDRSSISGEIRATPPPATSRLWPLSQSGTSEAIMKVFQPGADGVWSLDDFEQATASSEEVRKAQPAALTPIRPVPGFALGTSLTVDTVALLAAGKQGE